jgi:hypothetical protein
VRDLAAQLAYEDEQENLGRLDANDRTTCYTCQDWAGPEHRESVDHKRRIGIPEEWRYDEREGRYRPVATRVDLGLDAHEVRPGDGGSRMLVERIGGAW